MLREAGSGVRLALRRWPSALALATMIGLACLVLSLLLGDVLSQLAVLRGPSLRSCEVERSCGTVTLSRLPPTTRVAA